jgi:hypothetical protein
VVSALFSFQALNAEQYSVCRRLGASQKRGRDGIARPEPLQVCARMAPLINTTTDVQRIAGQSAVENPLAHRVVFEQLMDN